MRLIDLDQVNVHDCPVNEYTTSFLYQISSGHMDTTGLDWQQLGVLSYYAQHDIDTHKLREL